VVPIGGLRPFDVVGEPGDLSRPNVVRRIGMMANDPCAFFSRTLDGRPLMHAHVEPQWHASYTGYAKNAVYDRHGRRAIPDVNGCLAACDGPVYPGPRWNRPWWELWTHRWVWTVDTRTNRVRGA
jgi:hypothetical protein